MAKLSSLIADKTVAFDTAPLIYYIEEHPEYLTVADDLFSAIDLGMARGISSVLTLLEVLIKPLRNKHHALADSYLELLTNSAGITLFPLDEIISRGAAELRAKYVWLRTPDAIQIATAIEHRADLTITNDERWKDLTEIQVLFLKDFRSG